MVGSMSRIAADVAPPSSEEAGAVGSHLAGRRGYLQETRLAIPLNSGDRPLFRQLRHVGRDRRASCG
jgi:hypothetical protein